VPWMTTLPASLLGQPITLNSGLAQKAGLVLGMLVAFLIALAAAAGWADVLKFLDATPFGQTDPLFGRDVAFYVFLLPVYFLILGLIKFLIVVSLVGCGLAYFLQGKFTKSIDPKARIHMGILISLLLAAFAGSAYFSRFDLLTNQAGTIFGAAFTDANIMVPILRISVFIYGLAAVLGLFYGISGKLFPFLGAISLAILISLASTTIPSVFQKLVVAPNELVKETPFIKNNINATRWAYGLDKIEEREIAADKSITAADIAANNLTIKNVRLWDRAPLLSTFSQIQEIRTYYEFASVDNDRYTIDGEVRQIMLSPRELASGSLPNQNWINERLTFTHGYGVAGGPVNLVTPEGLPVLFVKDLPPKSEVKELVITRP
ncbi:MAG: UPF0182 family protein, partial [Candidatus Komeilibacteria bacterium]|nr:UPF0182 family protein [Candidatus Komeilibacteria bacterium]